MQNPAWPLPDPDKSAHGLAEIDTIDRNWHRWVCRCGEAGKWLESRALAQGDHAVHRSAESCRPTNEDPDGKS
jgi:hypothetical protein